MNCYKYYVVISIIIIVEYWWFTDKILPVRVITEFLEYNT